MVTKKALLSNHFSQNPFNHYFIFLDSILFFGSKRDLSKRMSSPENITDFEQYQDEFSETDNVIVNNSPKQFMYAYTSLNCIAILASIALIGNYSIIFCLMN